jgi:RHS repeat-associated protein
MRHVGRVFLVLALCMVASTAFASDPDQYLVVLSLHGQLTDAAVAAAGGVVTERFWDHVVATLTPAAIEALQSNRAVRYIQRIGKTVDPAGDGAPEVKAAVVRPPVQDDWTPPTWTSGAFQYDALGNITAIGTSTVPTSDGRTNAYTYYPDSTLHTWAETGQATQTYTYDSYGNLTSSGVSVSTQTNQLTGPGIDYDVAGNQTNLGNYGYDSLNMMTKKVGSANDGTTWYVYTPDDERIGALAPNIDKWNWTLRGFGTDVLREFQSSNSTPSSAWVWIEDHVYRGSGLLLSGERPSALGGQRHFHLDQLGTPRLVTGSNGSLIALHDYAPYGAEVTSPCQETNLGLDREEPARFTMHTRDFASSCADTSALDSMHARLYSSMASRFLSVDSASGTAADPHSWNRYSYARSNPLGRIDLDGLRDIYIAIWNSRFPYLFFGGSVGHAAAFELDGRVILSQFPAKHAASGPNQTKNYSDTVKLEGRSPDKVYKVFVPDDKAFDAEAKAQRDKKTWITNPDPAKDQTNCSIAIKEALIAGGVPVPDTWFELVPDDLDTWLKNSEGDQGTWSVSPVFKPDFVDAVDPFSKAGDDILWKLLHDTGNLYEDSFGTYITWETPP